MSAPGHPAPGGQGMRQAKFITFEGGEGVGKSTQAQLLAARLAQRGIDALLTREPGGSPFAEQVRSFILAPGTLKHGPLSEALLFNAARADHLEATIWPALDAGRWVICDRFSDSTLIYQGVAGGVARDGLEALEHLVVGERGPDLTVVLDLDPRDGLGRVGRRGRTAPGAVDTDRFEARDLDFHLRLRAGYLALAAAEPARCVVVDAAASTEATAEAVWHAVATRLLAEPG